MDAWQFHGHLGRNAEVNATKSGVPVVNFSVGVKRGWGEKESTLWVSCAWFGERAEKVASWLTKGRMVAILGEPDVRAWEKRDGSGIGCAIQCHVLNLDLLGGRDAGAPSATSAPFGTGSDSTPPPAGNDEDVPF